MVRAIEVRPGDRVRYGGEWRDVDVVRKNPGIVYFVSDEPVLRADGSEVVRVLKTLDGDEIEHRPRRVLFAHPDRPVRVERAEEAT